MKFNPLRRNFQKITTNRFVVDSPRFWRPEYHPYFSDIFQQSEFDEVFEKANGHMSFAFDSAFLGQVSASFYDWLSGFRFAAIPAKNPNSPKSFLNDMYIALLDVMPQITYTDIPVKNDDFNVVTHKAETGKKDTAKVASDETQNQSTLSGTEADILSHSTSRDTGSASTENVDEETNQNTKTVGDNFLSPQNQGVTPTRANEKGKGVEGITIGDNSNYTNNTQTGVYGETNINKANTSAQAQESVSELQQHNDTRSKQEFTNNMGMNQSQENVAEKTDDYTETLSYNKAEKLQEFADLNNNRLWFELQGILSRWILQMDIATSERNYLNCPLYLKG